MKNARDKRRKVLEMLKTTGSRERLVATARQPQSVIDAIKQHDATRNPELPPDVAAEQWGPASQPR